MSGCCIFWPAFGCCAPKMLVEIFIFSVFVLKAEKNAKRNKFAAKFSKTHFFKFAPKCWLNVLFPDLTRFFLFFFWVKLCFYLWKWEKTQQQWCQANVLPFDLSRLGFIVILYLICRSCLNRHKSKILNQFSVRAFCERNTVGIQITDIQNRETSEIQTLFQSNIFGFIYVIVYPSSL